MAVYTAVDDPSAHFKVKAYTGNGTVIGSGGLALTFDDTDTDMQPDLVWIKSRSTAEKHMLYDAVRGVTKAIQPDNTSAEGTSTEGLTAFGSNGFTMGTHDRVNEDGNTFVAWCWKANGQGSANTAGSINTTYTSANTTSGVSINLFSGTGANATIGHGLGIAPQVILCKNTASSSDNWNWNNFSVSALGNTGRIYFNEDAANSAAAAAWNSTAPTSTLVSLGSNGENNGTTMALYAFAEVKGFSKFGSLIANGAGGSNPDRDGTFVYCGFSPSLVIYKITDATGNWVMQDTTRDGLNPTQKNIYANAITAEGTSDGRAIDILSNGFKLRGGDFATNPVAFMAFAEAPLVNSEGVPCNAR